MKFLRDLNKEGFKTAVATSGPTENVNLVMDGLGLRTCFDVIVTGAEVARGKPEPDIFLLAARRMNFVPGECIVFEDSTVGIEGARRAGSPCIALATTHTKEELSACSAFRIISDFRSLRAADLRNAR
jgi:HAD superfamily hydrolase (TIGR01509 family)